MSTSEMRKKQHSEMTQDGAPCHRVFHVQTLQRHHGGQVGVRGLASSRSALSPHCHQPSVQGQDTEERKQDSAPGGCAEVPVCLLPQLQEDEPGRDPGGSAPLRAENSRVGKRAESALPEMMAHPRRDTGNGS